MRGGPMRGRGGPMRGRGRGKRIAHAAPKKSQIPIGQACKRVFPPKKSFLSCVNKQHTAKERGVSFEGEIYFVAQFSIGWEVAIKFEYQEYD